MSKSVFCLATSQEQAERIVQRLQASGFTTGDISVLHTDTSMVDEDDQATPTKAAEGMAKGATAGGITGGAIGLLAGIGALAIPGLGAFIAAGPIMAGLSGVALGATAGGLVGGLIGMGLPETTARHYEERVKRGSYLISAHAEGGEEIKRAREIFEAEGAGDVSVVDELKTLHS
jgi:uncharacterized membrane protein